VVAYSFRPRFIAPILAGTKRQTIRGDRKRHARPGEELQLFTGMRTQHCKLIGRALVEAVHPITLFLGDHPQRGWSTSWSESCPDPRFATYACWPKDCNEFARRDGFKSWKELEAFWAAEHPGLDRFEGVLIRWADLLPVVV